MCSVPVEYCFVADDHAIAIAFRDFQFREVLNSPSPVNLEVHPSAMELTTKASGGATDFPWSSPWCLLHGHSVCPDPSFTPIQKSRLCWSCLLLSPYCFVNEDDLFTLLGCQEVSSTTSCVPLSCSRCSSWCDSDSGPSMLDQHGI